MTGLTTELKDLLAWYTDAADARTWHSRLQDLLEEREDDPDFYSVKEVRRCLASLARTSDVESELIEPLDGPTTIYGWAGDPRNPPAGLLESVKVPEILVSIKETVDDEVRERITTKDIRNAQLRQMGCPEMGTMESDQPGVQNLPKKSKVSGFHHY